MIVMKHFSSAKFTFIIWIYSSNLRDQTLDFNSGDLIISSCMGNMLGRVMCIYLELFMINYSSKNCVKKYITKL
jgi:hypothetical protein